jgi:nucleotide-binding universal stress UspA family protein
MKILLALDTSSASNVALEEVVERPWPEGSSFEVLSIIEPSHVRGTDAAIRHVVHRVNEFVTSAVERLRLRGWEAGGGTLADDDPKVVILDRARSFHADLVVLGSHARSSVSRFMIGSVGAALLLRVQSKLFGNASVPLKVIRPKRSSCRPTARNSPMRQLHRSPQDHGRSIRRFVSSASPRRFYRRDERSSNCRFSHLR